MWVKKIKTAARVFREDGAKRVLRDLIEKVIDISDFVVMRRDLATSSPRVQCSIPFELRRIDDDTFEKFTGLPPPFPRHYQYRAEYGQRNCYGAYIRDDIGALLWVMFKADNGRSVNTWRYLKADEARIADVWAHPTYRGTGLIHVAMERMIGFLGQQGIRYVYVFTWQGNERAKRLYQKLGFDIIGKVWNVRWAWSKPGSGFHIRPKLQRDALSIEHYSDEVPLPDVIPGILK